LVRGRYPCEKNPGGPPVRQAASTEERKRKGAERVREGRRTRLNGGEEVWLATLRGVYITRKE